MDLMNLFNTTDFSEQAERESSSGGYFPVSEEVDGKFYPHKNVWFVETYKTTLGQKELPALVVTFRKNFGTEEHPEHKDFKAAFFNPITEGYADEKNTIVQQMFQITNFAGSLTQIVKVVKGSTGAPMLPYKGTALEKPESMATMLKNDAAASPNKKTKGENTPVFKLKEAIYNNIVNWFLEEMKDVTEESSPKFYLKLVRSSALNNNARIPLFIKAFEKKGGGTGTIINNFISEHPLHYSEYELGIGKGATFNRASSAAAPKPESDIDALNDIFQESKPDTSDELDDLFK